MKNKLTKLFKFELSTTVIGRLKINFTVFRKFWHLTDSVYRNHKDRFAIRPQCLRVKIMLL